MYCFNCGNKIPDCSIFCSFCGTKLDNQHTHDRNHAALQSVIDHKNYAQKSRKGLLVYLHDIMSLEFSIDKLKNMSYSKEAPIYFHDEWAYSKRYNLKNPVHQIDGVPITHLILSYVPKFNRYYLALGDCYGPGDKRYDFKGNEVTHAHGLTNSSKIMDKSMRDRLCTLPEIRPGKFWRDPAILNEDSLYWARSYLYPNINNPACFAEVKHCIEDFEGYVARSESFYRQTLPKVQKKLQDLKNEIERAEAIRDNLYSLNIIPKKFRDIGCMYFIYDFFSSSNTPLDQVFLHLDLNTIQSQLKQVLKNQQQQILQNAIIISQNEEIIAQNQQLFQELSNLNHTVNSNLRNMNAKLDSINESNIEAAEWARIAALNAEACAWFQYANYLK